MKQPTKFDYMLDRGRDRMAGIVNFAGFIGIVGGITFDGVNGWWRFLVLAVLVVTLAYITYVSMRSTETLMRDSAHEGIKVTSEAYYKGRMEGRL